MQNDESSCAVCGGWQGFTWPVAQICGWCWHEKVQPYGDYDRYRLVMETPEAERKSLTVQWEYTRGALKDAESDLTQAEIDKEEAQSRVDELRETVMRLRRDEEAARIACAEYLPLEQAQELVEA